MTRPPGTSFVALVALIGCVGCKPKVNKSRAVNLWELPLTKRTLQTFENDSVSVKLPRGWHQGMKLSSRNAWVWFSPDRSVMVDFRLSHDRHVKNEQEARKILEVDFSEAHRRHIKAPGTYVFAHSSKDDDLTVAVISRHGGVSTRCWVRFRRRPRKKETLRTIDYAVKICTSWRFFPGVARIPLRG